MSWGRVPTGSSLIKGHKTPAQGSKQAAWGGESIRPWVNLMPPSGCVLWLKYLTLYVSRPWKMVNRTRFKHTHTVLDA